MLALTGLHHERQLLTIQHTNLLFFIIIVHLKIIFILVVRVDKSVQTASEKTTFYYRICFLYVVTERACQVDYLVLALVE